jgi:glycosyltransferase involved in cell wall biosynthesis
LDDIKVFAAERGLSDRVVFTGARHDVPNLLKSFDVLVHPSHKEAFGRVIMEGMALGVPVVATRCGGPSEIIEDGINGILVPIADDAKMAESVRMLLNDEVKRKLIGSNGPIRIKQYFNIKQTVGQANDLFDQLLVRQNKKV